jgi:hypothetical protein
MTKIIRFLTGLAAYVAELHERARGLRPEVADRPPWWLQTDSIPAVEENFARWMGWRGPEEQEREIQNKRAGG